MIVLLYVMIAVMCFCQGKIEIGAIWLIFAVFELSYITQRSQIEELKSEIQSLKTSQNAEGPTRRHLPGTD